MDSKSTSKKSDNFLNEENNSKLLNKNQLLKTKKVSKLIFKSKFRNQPISIKEKHFQKFLNNILNNASSYNLLNTNNSQSNHILPNNNLQLIENNYKTLSKNLLKNNTEFYFTINNQKEKGQKNRKIVKFYNIQKAPQFKNIKDIDKDYIIPSKKSVIRIKSISPSHQQQNDINIIINSPSNNNISTKKKMNYNENKKSPEYNPSRVTNKFMDLFGENENNNKNILSFSKTYDNFKDLNDKQKSNSNIFKNGSKQKSNFSMPSRKNNISNADKKIFYCRKEKPGFPYLFESPVTFNNEYANKSEKSRHGAIIDGLNKLKYEMELNPEQKIYFLKEFLYKFHIKNFMEYSDEQLLFLSKIICQNDNTKIIPLLKPYFKTQDMLLDFIKNSYLIEKKDDNKDNARSMTNEKSTNDIINENLNMNNSANNLNDKKIFKSINDNIFLDYNTKIMKYNKSKSSFSKTEQSFHNFKKHPENSYTQNFRTLYYSPFYKPNISKFSKVSSKNKINEKKPKTSKFKKLDLSETSSQLKYLNFQTKLSKPEKEYCKNFKLLVDDVHEEIEVTKNKFNKIMEGEAISRNKKNSIPENKRNFQRYTEGFLFNTQVDYRRCKKLLQSEMKRMQKEKSDLAKNKKYNIKDTNKRLYYLPINYHFGYEQAKDEHKLTEMVAFHFAKKKLDDIQLRKDAKKFFGNPSVNI